MDEINAKFYKGQVIHHKLFDYRGVVVGIDPIFQGTEEWYQGVAKSRPPKNQPWYHVLVDQATHITYVAERNLESDDTQEPIFHPLINEFFDQFQDGHYSYPTN